VVDPNGSLWRPRAAIAHHHAVPQWRVWPVAVKCRRCDTEATIPLDANRRPRDTPIWKLEAALKCRSCKKGRYAPPVHMIKLTRKREITPYVWVHPNDDDRR
jgi:hypothetical protein